MEFNECYVCRISKEKAKLFDAISSKEKNLIKICEFCADKEDMPIIKKPTTFQLKEAEKKQRIYNKYFYSKPISEYKKEFQKFPEKRKIETSLRDLIDKNYKENVSKERKPRPDLADNFHWLIMVARRKKKLTQEQLAKEISESETAIKMAEQGFLPEDDYKIISKLESFLGIKIIKRETPKRKEILETPQTQPARILKFDPNMTKNLTIDDLKKMRAETEKPEEGK